MDKNTIAKMLQDCMAEGREDPQGEFVGLDSLMQIEGYVRPRAILANFREIVQLIESLPAQFRNIEEGWSMMYLEWRHDSEGQKERWGNKNLSAVLCLIADYVGIFQDTLKTLEFRPDALRNAPGGVSFVAFNIEPGFLEKAEASLRSRVAKL